jgi:AcrR family transcriptional regulator
MPKRIVRNQAMRTEATRAKLLGAAYVVFIRQGFADASIDAIAQKAGYTRGAFYANFKSKEDLLFAVYEKLLGTTLNSLRSRIKPAVPVAERMAAMRDYYLELVNDTNWLLFLLEFRLYVIRNARAVKRLEKLRATGLAEFDAFLKVAFSDFCCELHMRPETMHRAFIGLLYGLSVESLFRPHYLSKDDTKAIVFAFFEYVWPAGGATSAEDLLRSGRPLGAAQI